MGGKGSGDKPKPRTEKAIKKAAEILAKQKEAFLRAYAEMGVVLHATEAAGVHRNVFYRWQQEDSDFAEAAAAAYEASLDRLEAEAINRATVGTEEPVFYQGEKVATVRKKSDTLLMFVLNGGRPEKFAKRVKQDTTMHGGLTLNHLSDEDLDKKLAALEGGPGGTD